jgi:hypothetical protein
MVFAFYATKKSTFYYAKKQGIALLFYQFILFSHTRGTVMGLYRTYTIFFPKFEGFSIVQHFHGAIMLSWVMLMVVQPLLIQYRKVRMHKFAGKITYVLAPLLALSILMVSHMVYLRILATENREAALASMSNNIPDLSDLLFFIHWPSLTAKISFGTHSI